MNQPSIKTPKIVIVGGGAAGYLTALYIRQMYTEVNIKVIEDPNQPPIQLGESGNIHYTQTLEFLNIDIAHWADQVSGVVKLGGVLDNWRGDGKKYFHSRVSHYQSLLDPDQDDILYLKNLVKMGIPLYKTFLHGIAYEKSLIPYAEDKIHNWPATMYHFDSWKNAEYLKNTASRRNIDIVYGKVQRCIKSEEGTIDQLELTDGKIVDGDWIFDCTGLSKLILKKEYDVEFENLSKYFLARSVFTWLEHENIEYKFSTDINCRKYGWQWSIDVRHRRGNGYVYSKDFINEDRAIEEIETALNKKIKIQASFDWSVEYAKEISRKNVIAIGLSAGFLEPIEANGVLMITRSLGAVADHWNPYGYKETNHAINQRVRKICIEVIEFLCMHYQNSRNDTDFWKEFKSENYQMPFDLKDKITDLNEFLTIDKNYLDFDYSSYSLESWLMALQSFRDYSIKDFYCKKTMTNINRIEKSHRDLLTNAPTLSEWLYSKEGMRK